MKLRAEQLRDHLRKGLAAVYLVYGEEPLQLLEAGDAVRRAAREQGYTERECLTVETGFDWNGLWQLAASPSLFGDRRLLELRLGEHKPGDAGSKALLAHTAAKPPDAVLLVTCGKLDRDAQQSRWFGALEAAGVAVQTRPVDRKQLPGWIQRRLQAEGLQATPEAAALLADRVEGNLLAAAQEVRKLALLLGPGRVTAEQLLDAVGDSARFSIYDLVDTALAGQTERTVRIVLGLRDEGIESILVSWALHREICLLAALAFAASHRQPLDPVFAHYKVWDKRKPLLQTALERLPYPRCRRLLQQCGRLDQTIKGIDRDGEPWDVVMELSLELAGADILAGAAEAP